MYKGTLTNTTVTTTDIPYTTVLNTNDNTSPANGVVSITNRGYYNAQASVTLTGYTASADISLTLYANGVAIPESECSLVGSSTNTNEITLTTPVTPIKVIPATNGNATISARLSTGGTATSGLLTIQKVR